MRLPVRVGVWAFHLALPVLGLWLLIDRPAYDAHWEHHQAHFWLVLFTALANLGVGAVIGEAARRHEDARLFLVSLAFLVAAGFLALHATATPGVILAKNTGFVVATPIGLVLASGLALVSSVDFTEAGAARVLRLQGLLRLVVAVVLVGWGTWSLLDLPPLNRVIAPSEAHGPLVVLAIIGGAGFLVAAARYQLAYRRTPTVVRMSLITSFVLLAESMVAMAWGRNWQASWWEWHLLMTLGFGYVAYGAYVQYRREGSAAGLFESVALPATIARLRQEYGDALDVLVDAMESGTAPRRAAEQVGARFALTERQVDVLARAGEALAAERDQLRRQGALVAIGQASSVVMKEEDLLARAVALADEAFVGDELRVSLVDRGELGPAAGAVAQAAAAQQVPVEDEGNLAVPLLVKGNTAGVVEVRRGGGRAFADRDRLLFQSLAAQLATGLENARLYQQMDTLFRSYISPDVATALVADPSQAALGGETRDVTVLMADLKGFTPFSERSEPRQVVAMLNRYYGVSVPLVLAEGGTVVQFVGDALMALFNAPVLQADHARRAARAGLAMQAAVTQVADEHPGWPRFRVGINSGPALVGNIGAAAMRNFTAIGDTTNLAARLEGAAGAGQVVVSGTTAALLGPGASLESMGPLQVKGKAEPVEAYVLLSLSSL
jgi:class 3 adenylate cyclase